MTCERPLSSRAGLALMASILIPYFVISCWALRLPGLQYDEVLFANAALGHLDESFIAHEIKLGDWRVPLMLMTYLGALKAYLYAPLFHLFPISPLTVRLPVIIIGAATLILTCILVSRLAGWRIAAASALLMATDPSYIFHTRIDFGPTALMMFLKMASLLAFVTFVKTRRLFAFGLGSVLLGLGIFDKANFLWYAVSAPAAALIVWPKDSFRKVTPGHWVIGCGFAALSCSPFIYYNLATEGETFRGPILLPENFLAALKTRTGLLFEALGGSGVYRFVNGLNPSDMIEALTPSLTNTVTPCVAIAALVVACAARMRRQQVVRNPMTLFFSLLWLLIAAAIYLTHRPVGWHHYMMLWPFHYIALCLLLFRNDDSHTPGAPRPASGRAKGRLPATAVLSLMIASNLLVDASYLRALSREGGRGFFSDAIYELAEHALQQQDKRLIIMDWGFSTQLLLLSRGRIDKEEIFWELINGGPEEQALNRLHERAKDPSALFLFHAPDSTVYQNPRLLFQKMLERYQLKAETVRVFLHRRGDPVYVLLRVTPV